MITNNATNDSFPHSWVTMAVGLKQILTPELFHFMVDLPHALQNRAHRLRAGRTERGISVLPQQCRARAWSVLQALNKTCLEMPDVKDFLPSPTDPAFGLQCPRTRRRGRCMVGCSEVLAQWLFAGWLALPTTPRGSTVRAGCRSTTGSWCGSGCRRPRVQRDRREPEAHRCLHRGDAAGSRRRARQREWASRSANVLPLLAMTKSRDHSPIMMAAPL
ncbi:hypothetical protein K438DRAFT_465476 [Mycena galopus ATCC 62051]|nr:hypothetical protein K438DRAFT_465476 [Mycena galopus ATCC 62051]